jgi:transcriptional regulator with XRE-family HTH domain
MYLTVEHIYCPEGKIVARHRIGVNENQRSARFFSIGKIAGMNVADKTISEGLKPYAIGEKLRTLRLKKSMGLVQLGRHTGLSPAMLSKLERGKLYPTLPTLLRIAMVFGVSLEMFFSDERKRHVIAIARRDERLRFPDNPHGQTISYRFESLDFKANEKKLNGFYAEFEPLPKEKARMHQHPGFELLYIIRGKLELTIGSETHTLDEGDSVYFDSSVRHTYRRASKQPCSGVIVTSEAR